MNATQKNYLKDRIRQIANRKGTELYNWFDAQLTTKDIVEKEMLRQINSGEAKLKDNTNIHYYSQYFILNEKKLQKLRDKETAERQKLSKIREDKETKLEKEKQNVMDEIILGDETKALEMLRAFEQFSV